jgi:hypothetical protein
MFSSNPSSMATPALPKWQRQRYRNGNASATDIPTGNTVTLNLTDPDSMTIDLRGNIVLDSQADTELVFIRHPLTDEQTVGRLVITSGGVKITLDPGSSRGWPTQLPIRWAWSELLTSTTESSRQL